MFSTRFLFKKSSAIIGLLFTLIIALVISGETASTGLIPFETINLLQTSQLYQSSSSITAPNFEKPEQLPQQMQPIDHINLKGGTFWLIGQIQNTDQEQLVSFVPRGSLIDSVQLWIRANGDIQHIETGYLNDHPNPLHYGIDLTLPAAETIDYWVRIEGRYFSGRPTFQIMASQDYLDLQLTENLLVIGCLGALLVLSLYNLVIFYWVRDKSYFYYSLYLAVTFVGWSAVFNLFADLLNWRHLSLIFIPFFINITANVMFYQYFLDLKNNRPRLSLFSTILAWSAVGAAIVQFFLPEWIVYGLVNLFSALWLSTGLYAGIIRYREGFKAARFFILAFSIMVIGGAITVLPFFGLPDFVSNSYLATLICQTLDAVFLALALAERIRVLREEKDQATANAMEADQKANEALTRANNTLIEANIKLQTALEIAEEEKRHKDDFIITVSHELKTPLNSIAASLDILETSDSQEELDKTFKYVRYGVGRLSHQVQNIVMLAEAEKRDIVVQKRPFELVQLLGRLESIAHSALIEKPVQFDIKIDEQAAKEYISDSHLLFHMLSPMIENACIYTQSGNISVDVEQQGQNLVIYIKDTGRGMPQDKQKDIFESFSQLETGYSREHEGLGLGLTVTNQIAQLLNATIDVKSDEGKGTQFTVTIPVEIPYQRQHEDGQDLSGHILVVEDNQVNARVLIAILEKLGLDTELAEDGEKAVHSYESGKFDLILMDLQMPVMDGFRATEIIRQLDQSVPVVAVTANADSVSRAHCFEVGMNDVMDKPVRLKQVEKTLRRFLSHPQELH